jgi:hypothetical protein
VPFCSRLALAFCRVTHSMNISNTAFQLETRIPLPDNEVHLWRVDLATVATQNYRWAQILSEDERARAIRFRFSWDRQYFTAARALLRVILASHAASDPKELVFRYPEKVNVLQGT